MKTKEKYELEVSGARHRWYNYYSCDYCGEEYKKQKRQAEGALMEHYCSKECYFSDKNPDNIRVTLQCAHCGVDFTRPKSKMGSSKSGLYFCCREHKDIAQSYMLEIQPNHYGSGVTNYRTKAFKHYKPICNRCGFSNVSALEVHHKDRDRSNNDISNLEILCANCHTLEHKGLRTGVQR